MSLNINELKENVWDYVEREAHTTVISVGYVETKRFMGKDDAVMLVKTKDKEVPEYWVVGGDRPINLYSKSKFISADEAFSFHLGLMLRLGDRDYVESDDLPDEFGYDVFISHASEDKDDVVRPLAGILKEYGLRVWYDEFNLKLGDSLRKSIDQGLATSSYGIVVISPAFLSKQWPEYELNSLVAKEIRGKKVILPIWHNVTVEQVLKFSPSLADKLAASTADKPIQVIAKEICNTIYDELKSKT